jgi:PIN domain nuclease of toxin-antitoxin system
MNVLVDTHVWIWSLADPDRLSKECRKLLSSSRNVVYLSAASAWELAIKAALGKIDLPEPVETYVPTRMARQGITALPVTHAHALRVSTLPPYHRDPFDRLLVAQALVERLPILTADPAFDRYDVSVIPAARRL